MPDQISYYDSFGSQFEKDILACPEPETWTTDFQEKGRIYQEIKDRVETQKKLFNAYLKINNEVLDIGCGFGRQAIVLAKEGFKVTGIDTSAAFISISKKLFDKYHYQGEFIQTDLLSENVLQKKFKQIIILDVLEHIQPKFRKTFIKKIYDLSQPGSIWIISLPKVKARLLSKLNNRFRKSITQHIRYFFSREEHPYPIPEKKDFLRLMRDKFGLMNFESSNDTDFYVFRRE